MLPRSATQGARTRHAPVCPRGSLRRIGRASPQAHAHRVAAVSPATKPVGKPDAGNPHVRFDERGGETERASDATAPFLDSTRDRLQVLLARGLRAVWAEGRMRSWRPLRVALPGKCSVLLWASWFEPR